MLRIGEFLFHFCLFSFIGSHRHLALLNCLLPLIFLVCQRCLQLIFSHLLSRKSPRTEASSEVSSRHVKDGLSHGARLSVVILDSIAPSVESLAQIHVQGSLDEVGHDLVAEAFHLIFEVFF
jgi:hypothetical protein